MKNCNNCGAQLDDNAKFCHECGTKQEPKKCFCSECGAELKPDAKFCSDCGTPNASLKPKEEESDGLSAELREIRDKGGIITYDPEEDDQVEAAQMLVGMLDPFSQT